MIEGSTSKIFQSDMYVGDSIVFENREYLNPYRVTYVIKNDSSHNRTIIGVAEGEEVSYLFEFKKNRLITQRSYLPGCRDAR